MVVRWKRRGESGGEMEEVARTKGGGEKRKEEGVVSTCADEAREKSSPMMDGTGTP